MDPILLVAKDLKLGNHIIDSAKDFIRLMQLKLQSGSLKKAEHCRHVLALDIAASVMNEPCKREQFLRHTGISNNDYNQALMICKKNLNIKSNENILQTLCVILGDESLLDLATDILDKYKNDYIMRLDINQRKFIDLDSSLYQAAAILIAAKHNKIHIDKKRIFEASGVQNHVFNSVCKSLNDFLSENPLYISKSEPCSIDTSLDENLNSNKENKAEVSIKTKSTKSTKNNILNASAFRDTREDFKLLQSLNNNIISSNTNIGEMPNYLKSSRQLDTLKIVDEHRQRADKMNEDVKKVEKEKFEKFKEFIFKKKRDASSINLETTHEDKKSCLVTI